MASSDTSQDTAGPFYLNKYVIDKRYGGPEEGGWWYETGKFEVCHGAFETFEKAQEARHRMNDTIEEERDGRHTPDSVLCTGWPVLYIEGSPGKDFPTEPVRYM